MNHTASSKRHGLGSLLALVTCLALALGAFAQTPAKKDPKTPTGGTRGPANDPTKTPVKPPTTPTTPAATPTKATPPAPAMTPTEMLEERLMASLASRDMDNLLTFYFQKNNIPQRKQEAIMALSAWPELMDSKTLPARKVQLLKSAVKGVDLVLSNSRDTKQLMNQAGLLIEAGMKGQVNQIEYFGPSPTKLTELNETATAVKKILDKVCQECESQQNGLLAGKTRPDDMTMKQWQELDDRLQAARWTRAFSAYGLALSMDEADAKRKEVPLAAIAFLKDFEAPEFQREAAVRIQIGKLMMVSGDFDGAIKKFKEAETKKPDKFSQYEIKFFTALNALLAKRDKAADAALTDLQGWCKSNLSAEEQKEVSAGTGLLEYRICELKATAQKNPKFSEAGEAALTRVMKDNPKLEPVIKRMLLEKLPPNADITKLDTVLLRALLAKGVDEYIRAKDGAVDAKGTPIVERAIQAAKIIEGRKGQPTVTDDIEDEAVFLQAMLLGKIGRYGEAIEESLHYIAEHKKSSERAELALNNALTCVEHFRRDPEASKTAKNSELINRTWELAIATGQKQYCFMYGKRLFDQGQYKKAAEILRKTPANHPSLTHAKFFELSSLQQLLNEKNIEPGVKKNLIEQIQKVAAEVNQRIDADMAKATDDTAKSRLKFYKVSATLLASELALNELKDPPGALKMLEGLEESAKGLAGEEQLIGTALHLRVNALMALNKTPEAVAEVKRLVETGAKNAAAILYQMLKKMDDSYEVALKRDDKEQKRILSAGQAALIGLLIEQTKDEKIRDAYRQREAQLLLIAARQEPNAEIRGGYLKRAQGTFTELLGKVPEGSPQQDTLRYKLALISYELKDYKKVQQELGQLISQGKLGPPEKTEDVNGVPTTSDNPVYWEGLLRFMQANYELARAEPANVNLQEAMANSREVLRTHYINRGANVGGEKFRDEYAKLKAAILPGFDETKLSTTRPATPATQPAATQASGK